MLMEPPLKVTREPMLRTIFLLKSVLFFPWTTDTGDDTKDIDPNKVEPWRTASFHNRLELKGTGLLYFQVGITLT
jgi:hypothetical protein